MNYSLRKRLKKFGFRRRMKTGRHILARKRRKGRKILTFQKAIKVVRSSVRYNRLLSRKRCLKG